MAEDSKAKAVTSTTSSFVLDKGSARTGGMNRWFDRKHNRIIIEHFTSVTKKRDAGVSHAKPSIWPEFCRVCRGGVSHAVGKVFGDSESDSTAEVSQLYAASLPTSLSQQLPHSIPGQVSDAQPLDHR